MDDMRSYENKYRKYLEDDNDTFLNPEGSQAAKFIMGGTATVGLLAGGLHAYHSGQLKGLMHSMILRAGRFRRGKIHALSSSVRTWSQDEGLGGGEEAVRNIIKGNAKEAEQNIMDFYRAVREGKEIIKSGMREHQRRTEELSVKKIINEEVNLKQRVNLKKKVYEQLKKENRHEGREWKDARRLIDESIVKEDTLNPKEQQVRLNQTGFRHATIQDLIDQKQINPKDEKNQWIREGMTIMEQAAKEDAKKRGETLTKEAIKEAREKFLQKRADPYILIDESGNIADLRDFRDSFKGIIHSLTTDFTIPLVKINPLRMFYLDHFFSNVDKPMIHLANSSIKNPIITGHNGSQGSPHLFIDGTIYNLAADVKDEAGNIIGKKTEKVGDGFFLADAQRGPVARLLRNMSGISISQFDTPSANAPFLTKVRYHIQSLLDIGFQDEPPQQFDLFDPTSWVASLVNIVTGKLRMEKYAHRQDYLSDAFGKNADYIYMRKYKSIEEAGSYKQWLSQFGAGRDNMDNVTLATLFPYGFFERLNATIAGMNLGLSNKAQGDAFKMFGNLLLKRVVPVWAGIELWDYLNYESENLVGFQFEDAFARMYANSSVELAKIRDNLGITEWAKGVSPLLVGGEQIADIPFFGNLVSLNQTAEELEEFWEEGEVAVRKGRWWPLGNCVHPNTPIQVTDGRLIQAKEIKVGDHVFTHLGESRKILRVIRREMKEREYAPEIKVYGFPDSIVTTDNHPYLAVKKKECPSSSYADCKPNRHGSCCQKQRYLKCLDKDIWEPKWTLARYLEEGDYLAYPRIKFNGSITHFDGIPMNKEIGYMIGIFLAEGNIDKWVNEKGYTIKTSHHISEVDICEKLESTYEKYFGVKGSLKQTSKNGIKYRVSSRKLTKWLQDLLYQDRDKRFIDNIHNYSEEFSIGLLKGILEGDGHLQKHGSDSLQIIFTSARINYIIGIRNILFGLGILNTVHRHGSSHRIIITGDDAKILYRIIQYRKKNPVSNHLNHINNKHMHMDHDYVYLKIQSIHNSGYFGTVYDFEVEGAHSFCGASVILHNTPFTGGKVDYYQPNWVRRTLADVKFSESQYGSREEYFENTWMPTPRHPFAPIRHFFTDPYHWEKKHYEDRPYLLTGGISEIENFPLIGPFLNSTVGQVLKPERAMHEEYWTQGPIVPIQEQFNSLELVPTAEVSLTGEINVGASVIDAGGVGRSAGIAQEEMNQVLASYVTSSGQVSVYSLEDEQQIYNDLAMLSERSPTSTGLYKDVRIPSKSTDLTPVDPSVPDHVASVSQMVGNLHYNIGEMGGFYGFIGFTLGGEMFDEDPIIQSSSDVTSYTRAFWDQYIGGYGGDFNEIFRRFVPNHRRLDYYNPVENTMPDWLPGSNYFIDFQTGDPYVKVMKGEMRLPGEGYERMYGIDMEDKMKLRVGASFIGYDEESIRTHMLSEDAYKDEALMRILSKGTKWHDQWDREMADQEIAIRKNYTNTGEISDRFYIEQYVADESAQIAGFYDVLADHSKWLEWLQNNNMVEFTYYQASDGGGDPAFDGYYQKGVKISDWSETDQQSFFEHLVEQSPEVLIDPKTRGSKSWEKDEMHFENVQQVNFYANQLGTPINYLIHVDRQNPDRGIKVFAFEANPDLLDYTYRKVQGVREGIYADIESGRLHQGNLYDMIDRFRILADVAPYSDEYRTMKKQIRNMGLTEDELEEVREIESQVSERKQHNRLYNYRYKYADVEDMLVTVDQVIDNNVFTVKEFPDNPIRLAGVTVSNAQDNPVAHEAQRELSRTIKEGNKIRIAIDADESTRVKDDTYKTIGAVVYDSKGRNVNKYLIEQELGKERENDFTPASVHARFTPTEIRFGALWEQFAHMDTVIHTKMLQVRSPLESYERREVYGKDFQSWEDPIDNFLIPAIEKTALHNPIVAVALGGFIGASFGSLKPTDIGGERITGRYGKIVGGAIGASIMGIATLNRMWQEYSTGEAWIPERRQKERDTEEYFDVLEYIKYNRLYNQYATLAKKREGFDVKEYIKEHELSGEERKERIQQLESIKRELYTARPNQIKEILGNLDALGIAAKSKEDAMKAINAELNRLRETRQLEKITPIAAKALMYHKAQQQTMYGYEPGDPIANVLAAVPRKEREYLVPFLSAPEEERDRILDVVPSYLKRVLQSAWGMPVDEKMPLQEYFSDKPLPSANWKGWDENVAINDIKVKFVDRMGLDPGEFNIWDEDKERAARLDVEVPDAFRGRETAESYSRKLKEILLGFNVQGLEVDVVQSNKRGVNVEMDIDHDRSDDVKMLINREGYRLF